MAMHCIECDYKMKTIQVIISAIGNEASFFSGMAHQEVGESVGVQCPHCGAHGHWKEDV